MSAGTDCSPSQSSKLLGPQTRVKPNKRLEDRDASQMHRTQPAATYLVGQSVEKQNDSRMLLDHQVPDSVQSISHKQADLIPETEISELNQPQVNCRDMHNGPCAGLQDIKRDYEKHINAVNHDRELERKELSETKMMLTSSMLDCATLLSEFQQAKDASDSQREYFETIIHTLSNELDAAKATYWKDVQSVLLDYQRSEANLRMMHVETIAAQRTLEERSKTITELEARLGYERAARERLDDDLAIAKNALAGECNVTDQTPANPGRILDALAGESRQFEAQRSRERLMEAFITRMRAQVADATLIDKYENTFHQIPEVIDLIERHRNLVEIVGSFSTVIEASDQ
ncbi:hypothetical protein JR316_0011642 [Psilocybe cubensis]|uniref:Uncharacterized protein n=1 Tax=Psilocybe cubensis TaxID=181762 RepID=A0ACB8GL13_PSICU|nr:hypothetical protein JR316_0011642 [Psilocybe cubensis]KAH9476072.1 hypothetical protein JR316_0011642 [Psilocybe cubensis]